MHAVNKAVTRDSLRTYPAASERPLRGWLFTK